MTRYYFVMLCLTTLALTSCKKNTVELPAPDYLIFGHFYRFCTGEKCIEIFRLEKDRLFEDTKDQYPNSYDFYVGNYTQLSQQKFTVTKDLMDYFPADLLKEIATVIGQPDIADGGGLYVEYNFNGVRKFWLLDQVESNVPDKYHDFIDKINEKIKQLQ